jgi:hypothetical protein
VTCCQVMIVMFVPMILTFLGNIFEFAARPTMEVAAVDLSASTVVLTGGCGTVGLQLAIMLAEAGAVVLVPWCDLDYAMLPVAGAEFSCWRERGRQRERGRL